MTLYISVMVHSELSEKYEHKINVLRDHVLKFFSEMKRLSYVKWDLSLH